MPFWYFFMLLSSSYAAAATNSLKLRSGVFHSEIVCPGELWSSFIVAMARKQSSIEYLDE